MNILDIHCDVLTKLFDYVPLVAQCNLTATCRTLKDIVNSSYVDRRISDSCGFQYPIQFNAFKQLKDFIVRKRAIVVASWEKFNHPNMEIYIVDQSRTLMDIMIEKGIRKAYIYDQNGNRILESKKVFENNDILFVTDYDCDINFKDGSLTFNHYVLHSIGLGYHYRYFSKIVFERFASGLTKPAWKYNGLIVGGKYDGCMLLDKFHGPGTFTYDEHTFKGQFKHGKFMSGVWTIENKSVGNYSNNTYMIIKSYSSRESIFETIKSMHGLKGIREWFDGLSIIFQEPHSFLIN